MIHIIHDGSFVGLMNAYDYIFTHQIHPNLISQASNFQTNFLARQIFVKSDQAKFEQFILFLTRKGLKYLEEHLYKVYLANTPGFEMLLYQVIFEQLSEKGEQTSWRKLERLIKKIDKTLLQLEAGVRFREERGFTFFASISPEYNLLPLLAENLTKKYPHTWVLYDEKRRYGLEYDLEKLERVNLNQLALA